MAAKAKDKALQGGLGKMLAGLPEENRNRILANIGKSLGVPAPVRGDVGGRTNYKRENLKRLQNNPDRGFGALEKIMKKLPKEKREALQSNFDSLFSNLGQGGQGGWADKFRNMPAGDQRAFAHFGSQNLSEAGLTGNRQPQANVRSSLMPKPQVPQLNLGGMSGTMGMVAPQPAPQQTNQPQGTSAPGGTPPTINDTVKTNVNTTPPSATSANKSPIVAPNDAASLLGGGVNTNQLQNAVRGSAALNTPVNNAQTMFQGTYGDLINMPGQVDVANQFATPGRSMVGGAMGEGGLATNQMQQLANAATAQGLQNRQQMIGQNINQQMQTGKMASDMDMSQRQQMIGHLGTMLGPAMSGQTQGFQAALGGITANI